MDASSWASIHKDIQLTGSCGLHYDRIACSRPTFDTLAEYGFKVEAMKGAGEPLRCKKLFHIDDAAVWRLAVESVANELGMEYGGNVGDPNWLPYIQRVRPAVAIFDMELPPPTTDGLSLAKRHQESDPSCLVIVLSARDEVTTRAAEVGLLGLRKPTLNKLHLVKEAILNNDPAKVEAKIHSAHLQAISRAARMADTCKEVFVNVEAGMEGVKS